MRQDRTVSDHHERPPGPGERNVRPPGVGQEPDLTLGVRPDEGNDDCLLLPALESVDAVDLDARLVGEAVAEEADLGPLNSPSGVLVERKGCHF